MKEVRKKVHLIGIGGIGMSGIAQILLRSGYAVTGSDLRKNAETAKLKEMGAQVYEGHRAENIGQAELAVFSSAVAKDNPELVEAKRRGLPILARAEMLAELMRKKKSIVVAGAHGKTTTSAMITSILMEAGFDPTAVIGGKLRSIAGNAKMGSDDWFVAESDESDGSFLHLLPTLAVITNIDREHLNHYGTFEKLEQAFVDFANRVPFDGRVVVCKDDAHVARALSRIERAVTTYGIEAQADIRGVEVRQDAHGSSFCVERKGTLSDRVQLCVPGTHNVLNALAAIAVAELMGVPSDVWARALKKFSGIDRRLELKGEAQGIRVIDDYAHHPTEIQASLQALRTLAGSGAIRVLFQPHRYSRLQDLWDLFVRAFDGIEEVAVAPVYAASEPPIDGVSSAALTGAILKREKTLAYAVDSIQVGAEKIAGHAHSGDILVTMGAGDVTHGGAMMLGSLVAKKREAR